METEVAEQLVNNLERRLSIQLGDKEREQFTRTLKDLEFPKDTIYIELPDKEAVVEEDGNSYATVNLRRVFRRNFLSGPDASIRERAYDTLVDIARTIPRFRVFSSDYLSRELQRNKTLCSELLRIVPGIDCFFLLAKQEKSIGGYDPLFRETKPLLVLPQGSATSTIQQWEEAHTTYQVSGILGILKTVSKGKYQKRLGEEFEEIKREATTRKV